MGILKTLTVNGVQYAVTPIVPADSVTLLASAWESDGDTHHQVVKVPGVTAHTKIDLQPTAEQLAEFHYKVLAFVAENDNGIITVYSIGDKPTGDHTIQITKTEVQGSGLIRGNTVGTTMPRPDWNQTDPRKADYIKNKPQSFVEGGYIAEEELADKIADILEEQNMNGGRIDEHLWWLTTTIAYGEIHDALEAFELVSRDEDTDDYRRNVVTFEELEEAIGNIETVLDSIIAIQTQLIGGDGV